MRYGLDTSTAEFSELPRLEQCKRIRNGFNDQFKNWIDKAKRSNTYLRGSHFTAGLAREGLDPDDYLPEDRHPTGDAKLYPSIPYALSIIDRMVQYIRHDEGDILVTAEGRYAYPNIPPELLAIMPELEGQTEAQLSEAEMVAKMLTARIDLFSERSGVDSKLTEIAMVAASQRVAFVCVDWIDDETSEEPVHTKIVPIGNYWFDPDASCVNDAQWLGYESEMDKEAAERKYGVEIASERKTVKLYHHYTRDYTIQELERESENENAEDAEYPPNVEGYEAEGGIIYKYPSAWRYTVTTKGQVLYDGELTTPAGKPPVVVFTWRSLPRSMIGFSVLDATETINNNIDRVVQYIMQSAYRGLPKTAVDTALVDDPDALNENDVQAFLFFNSTKGSGPAYNYISGSPVPESLYALLDTLKALGSELSGADGVQMEDASKFKLSGDAIEGLAADREGIASRVRDAWYIFLTDYYELVIRFIMAYEKDEVSLSIETPQGTVDFSTSMAAYEFDDAEFEARFDVSVFSPKNMPKNPVRRAQYLLELLNTVAGLVNADPELARLYVDMADLPNKQALLEYIESKIQTQEMMPEQAAQIDPEQIKIQERRASDAAKSVMDGLESLAKELASNGQYEFASQVLESIPAKGNAAYQQVMAGNQPMPVEPIQEEVVNVI